MRKFRVAVYTVESRNGYVTIEAPDATEAHYLAHELDEHEILDDAVWGSCGDTCEVYVDHPGLVEEIREPSVSDDLWK